MLSKGLQPDSTHTGQGRMSERTPPRTRKVDVGCRLSKLELPARLYSRTTLSWSSCGVSPAGTHQHAQAGPPCGSYAHRNHYTLHNSRAVAGRKSVQLLSPEGALHLVHIQAGRAQSMQLRSAHAPASDRGMDRHPLGSHPFDCSVRRPARQWTPHLSESHWRRAASAQRTASSRPTAAAAPPAPRRSA